MAPALDGATKAAIAFMGATVAAPAAKKVVEEVVEYAQKADDSGNQQADVVEPGLSEGVSASLAQGQSSPSACADSRVAYDKAVKSAAEQLASSKMSKPRSFSPPPSRRPKCHVHVTSGRSGPGIQVDLPFPWGIVAFAGSGIFSGNSPAEYKTVSEDEVAGNNASTHTAAASAQARGQSPNSSDSEDDADTSQGGAEAKERKLAEISQTKLRNLLKTDGEEIYKKLKEKAGAEFAQGSGRTMWSNKDYRVDAGHFDRKNGMRNWELQVNREAGQGTKSQIRGKRATHKKLYKDVWDVQNPPAYDKWLETVLDAKRFKKIKTNKISYLQEALNGKMKAALIGSDPSAISSYVGLAKRCDSLSSQMELLGQWKRPRGNTKSSDNYDNHENHGGQAAQKHSGQKTEVRREDMMEWEPTPQASAKVNSARTRSDKNTYGYQSKRPEDQVLLGKRAKWVDQAEMDARYREGRCLRCGRDNCRIERCPLAAPIRPANATRRTQVNAVAPSRPAVTKAEIAEDDAITHNGGKDRWRLRGLDVLVFSILVEATCYSYSCVYRRERPPKGRERVM
ncbi:hypothetical protein HIM_10080 [Hirsutella minnesotensis 3608]|uniref:Uncharacterized protein n=1 Tax=Hirsutella minnesotensis 3608 TaxID=1043627 RepID=A0A0F7ZGA2_9HYPO|nr:hypothetical protein HIM_10080 [Hirsutella minnesotensis 3608]